MQINDGRVIATVGRNSVTGDSGGVLLTPAGTLDGAWLTYDWNTTGLKRGSTQSLVVVGGADSPPNTEPFLRDTTPFPAGVFSRVVRSRPDLGACRSTVPASLSLLALAASLPATAGLDGHGDDLEVAVVHGVCRGDLH